jgi:Calcineurin-like phosphoesterase
MPVIRTIAASTVAVAVAATLSSPLAPGAHATPHHDTQRKNLGYSFAVIGDVPYGDEQLASFPGWIEQINADPEVSSVVHLGDIKDGSSVCSDEYFATIRAAFDTFEDALVYTPGDNEWTDCHRETAGAYDPLERLTELREVFFDRPGRSLGQQAMPVDSQIRRGLPENVIYQRADLTFVAAHVTGSNNGLEPWEGLGRTEPTAEQRSAVRTRTRADIRLLRKAFRQARKQSHRGVVVMQQADMFDPTYTPTSADIGAYTPWVQALIEESTRFEGPVYLFNGDSHAYNADRPLASGSPWLTTYGVEGAADNLTRVTVNGSDNNVDWLRVSVNDRGSADLLSWERVPYTDERSSAR